MQKVFRTDDPSDDKPTTNCLEAYEMWPMSVPEAPGRFGGAHDCDWPRETSPIMHGI
ncbi:hypothetical protein OG873_07645 [Streptomyces violaceus]|uniref:Uncharacterized protein n=1 Tax=Streptomyces violaceus TaxID=1936 RepID=A0ABZ1P1J0_STRVL